MSKNVEQILVQKSQLRKNHLQKRRRERIDSLCDFPGKMEVYTRSSYESSSDNKEKQRELSFADVLQQWQDANAIRLKGGTKIKYENLIRSHIIPELGQLNICEITSSTINRFLTNKLQHGRLDGQGGLSASYVRSISLIITAALHYAVCMNLCPPLKSKICKPSIVKKDLTILSADAQRNLENAICKNPSSTDIGIMLSLYTGLRIGEICALSWEDVDFSTETIHVRHTVSRIKANKLQLLVKAKYNIFISGGTGSGKTTFLNALSNYIPKDERVITIEDSAELQITGVENLVSLETRNANASGAGQITIRDLIKSSLRMRPERIVVGEVRGGEALDMLQEMNTGHDGSLSTGHANSTEDMLSRLETMVLQGAAGLPLPAIRQQIASAVDIIIHLSRLRDKSRKTMEICEVVGYEPGADGGRIILNPLYVFEEDENSTLEKVSGSLNRTDNPMRNDYKLKLAGIKIEI